MLRRAFKISAFFVKLAVAYFFAFFIKIFDKSKQNIWIISERCDDARDNGYFFYKYVVENHPEQPIWFVIKSSSADFPRIEKLGRWVEYGTFRHYLIYALSTVRICSSMWGGDLPNGYYFSKVKNFMSKKRKFVFLKHGIYKDFDPSSMAEIFHPDLFIAGAKPEYDHIRRAYHHPEGVVQYTGLARFDNLHNIRTKNQILVMPTFRRWLQGQQREMVEGSEYVSRYTQLLNDERLASLLEKYQMELIFYPHYVMQPYVDLFTTNCNRIKIARFADYDVQQLLIESKLLITDFSSVFFDFGYMEKPVVFYQFDRERYIREHYDFTKGYFSYDRDGFGEVIYEHDGLVDLIEMYIRRDFALSDTYAQRIDKFFPLKDTHNCDRIYERIMELLKK